MARPTKLTKQLQEGIVRAIGAGSYAHIAAQSEGIDPSTYHRWMKRGDPESRAKADAPYREFRRAVEQAKAQSEVRDVALITRAAADGDWRAAAWKLSHS